MTANRCKLLIGAVSPFLLFGCGTNPYSGITADDSSVSGTSDAVPDTLNTVPDTNNTEPDSGTGTTNLDGGLDLPTSTNLDGGLDSPTYPSLADIYVGLSSVRELDLVFMLDNSPNMAAKQSKLKAEFPRLLAALENPVDRKLPDLRVAIVNSDLGTGGALSSGACGPKPGSTYGDLGKFQMIGASACGVTEENALWLEYRNGSPLNYTGSLGSVFDCLASNVGTLGCGYEHSLQAFEFALVAQGIGNEAQQKMLRATATLGLVFLTDEDDCSAATNDGMFAESPGGFDLKGESASLRCATRAHTCGGRVLTAPPPGYPTTESFEVPFSTCAARTDSCPNAIDGSAATDTSVPTSCSPLRDVRHIADEIKALKGSPSEVFVAGIFGWPLSDADMATATYKIAPIPNPVSADTAHPTIYNYWPVCYDPSHKPQGSGYDQDAFSWGATGGLRNAAFVDEFGDNGMKFSICQSDFGTTMQTIGYALANKVGSFCISRTLRDGDTSTPGLQPVCQVFYQEPMIGVDGKAVYTEGYPSLPACPAGASNGNVQERCWQLQTDAAACPTSGYGVAMLRPQGELIAGPVKPGSRLHLSCQICQAGSSEPGCSAN